jgi:hypothetical protein
LLKLAGVYLLYVTAGIGFVMVRLYVNPHMTGLGVLIAIIAVSLWFCMRRAARSPHCHHFAGCLLPLGQQRERLSSQGIDIRGDIMTVPVRRLRAAPAVSDDELEDGFAPQEFYSGERICPEPERLGGGVLRGLMVIAVALGGGWALIGYQDAWRGWLASELSAFSSAIDQRAPAPVAAASATALPPPLPPPAPVAEPVTPPQAVAVDPPAQAEAQSDVTTASIEPQAEAAAAPQPLPPPIVDPADPYQKRALAVGLHPKLSRVLLTKLSPADYRNAQTAIETAVAKTPDTGTFVWPRQRTPELALFEVHFVPGAAPHCRRYVVIVTKDRWSTTALPMEKCGTSLKSAKGK